MGNLVGHVCPGLSFFALGFWHLFNHIKLYILQPNSYRTCIWFPCSLLRHLELFLIIIGCIISISMELFIMPSRHQPFDPDGTIPSSHLRHFEHSLISMLFLVYASFAIILDKIQPIAHKNLTQLLASIALCQYFYLFYLHSTDHNNIEGQYHWILQLIVFVSFSTTLLGIGLPKSFLISFVRSISLLFQGVWFIVMGIMVWTPQFMPKGCSIRDENDQAVPRCESHEALHRAKSLINILFSWLLILITIFSFSFYLYLAKIHGKKVQYSSLMPKETEDGESDVESQESNKLLGESN